MKFGFFGGTFDPLHFGHLNLVVSLAEKHALDRVLFCPVNQSPFKEESPTVSSEHRLAMTLLGIQDHPVFQLCKLELERGGVSYTVDTLRELKGHIDGSVELFLLLSSESIDSFDRWKGADEIVRLAQPLIGARSKENQKIPDSPLRPILQNGLTPTPLMEISSTAVRNRLKKNLYCGHLVPAIILDYIRKHRLYS